MTEDSYFDDRRPITLDFLKLTESEFELVNAAAMTSKRHPLARALSPASTFEKYVSSNTHAALVDLERARHSRWIAGLKQRVLEQVDLSDSSSALAEIRALGFLCGAGFDVKVIPVGDKPTAECKASVNGSSMLVEVHAKQMNNEEARALSTFRGNMSDRNSDLASNADWHVVSPFGPPRPGEAGCENAISKLASIKPGIRQLQGELPTVLWLDLQDEDMSVLFDFRHVLPVYGDTSSGFFTGVAWAAFYGKKGDPLFDGEGSETDPSGPGHYMQHSGRFETEPMISAVVLSLPTHTVVMENPNARIPLTGELQKALFGARWFSHEFSRTSWPDAQLPARLSVDRRLLATMADAVFATRTSPD